MKTTTFLIFLLLVSCKNFDVNEAKNKVILNSNDLQTFGVLNQEFSKDSKQISNLMNDNGKWITTNSYYLNQIDSIKYTKLLKKITGKYIDDFKINDKGDVCFILKQSVNINSDNYNDSYVHQLINSECDYKKNFSSQNGDTIFSAFLINSKWRYVSRKFYTGH